MKKARWRWGTVLLAIASIASACAGPGSALGPSSNPQPQRAALKRITAGIPSDPPILYNKLNVGGVGGQGNALQDLVHVGLTTYDIQRTLQPRLASSVPSLENGQWRLAPDGHMETT